MATYHYGVYYAYNGPTRGDPFREQLSQEEVEHRLTRFPLELEQHFADAGAAITADYALDADIPLSVTVVTEVSKAESDELVARCLKGLDLFGKKL